MFSKAESTSSEERILPQEYAHRRIFSLLRRKWIIIVIAVIILVTASVILARLFRYNVSPFAKQLYKSEMPNNYKVVFIADQGLSNNSKALLTFIRNSSPDLVLHQGDFDYVGKHFGVPCDLDDPTLFFKQIDDYLGSDIPLLACVGNHDLPKWSEYKRIMIERLEKWDLARNCTGEYGEKFTCVFYDMTVVFSSVGTLAKDHETYITETLSLNDKTTWKVCSWHKNMRKYQAGSKSDETGYGVYDACRKYGAIIATGHEHSYSRTHLMDDYEKGIVASKDLNLKKGKSFAFVSGVGGMPTRTTDASLVQQSFMAVAFGKQDGLSSGGLFCTLKIDGVPGKGKCQFIDINGKVWDEFQMTSE
jgi:hypothetical protein